jgi:hypothetical protein
MRGFLNNNLVGEVQTILKHGRPAEAGGGPPSGLGHRPRAATALCRFAAGPGGIALQRDLQSCLARNAKQNSTISLFEHGSIKPFSPKIFAL